MIYTSNHALLRTAKKNIIVVVQKLWLLLSQCAVYKDACFKGF